MVMDHFLSTRAPDAKEFVEQMKALLLSSPGALAVADLDTPSPAAGEVLVRIAACGICGSDVSDLPVVSRVAPLVEGPELFARLYRQEPGLVKVVLQP